MHQGHMIIAASSVDYWHTAVPKVQPSLHESSWTQVRMSGLFKSSLSHD